MRKHLQKSADVLADMHNRADQELAARLGISTPVAKAIDKAIPLRVTSAPVPDKNLRVETVIQKKT